MRKNRKNLSDETEVFSLEDAIDAAEAEAAPAPVAPVAPAAPVFVAPAAPAVAPAPVAPAAPAFVAPAAPVAPVVPAFVAPTAPAAPAAPVDEKAAAIAASPFAQFVADIPAAPAAPAPAAADNAYSKPLVINGAVFKPLPNQGPQPIVAPSSHVQLTPIVVPIAMVPFASQNQPVMQYADEEKKQPEAKAEQPVAKAMPVADTAQATSDAVYYEEEPVEYVTADGDVVLADDVISGNPISELAVNSYSEEKVKAPKQKGGGRGRAIVMLFASLVFLLPFLLRFVVSEGIIPAATANQELFAGISLSKMADGFLKYDVIGGAISAISTSQISTLFANIGDFILLVAVLVAVCTFVASIVGIAGGFRFKYWISGLAMFVLVFVALVYTLLTAATSKGGFSLDALVDGVLGNIGLVKLFLVGLLVFIVSMLVRFKAPKEKKAKKKKGAEEEVAPEVFETEIAE